MIFLTKDNVLVYLDYQNTCFQQAFNNIKGSFTCTKHISFKTEIVCFAAISPEVVWVTMLEVVGSVFYNCFLKFIVPEK